MSLFSASKKPAKLKMGIFGETGTGKTYTAVQIMTGLWKYLNATKPIAIFDTEGGAGYIKKKFFDDTKIPLVVCASTSFKDLCEGLKEAEREFFGVIIDQESRFWDEFRKQYMRDVKQNYLSIGDWGILKPKWAEYNYLYLNTDIHIIKLGRSANIFESGEELVGGKKKSTFVKVGTKFRSESESGYEPSLLCEIEKVFDEGNGEYSRILHVVKDRFDLIDSKDFANPKFEDFLPHIQGLDISAVQSVIDNSPKRIFDEVGDDERAKRARRREILCAEMAALMVSYIPGTTAGEKKIKCDILFKLFGVRSWESIEKDWQTVPLEKIEDVMAPKNNEPSEVEKVLISLTEGAR